MTQTNQTKPNQQQTAMETPLSYREDDLVDDDLDLDDSVSRETEAAIVELLSTSNPYVPPKIEVDEAVAAEIFEKIFGYPMDATPEEAREAERRNKDRVIPTYVPPSIRLDTTEHQFFLPDSNCVLNDRFEGDVWNFCDPSDTYADCEEDYVVEYRTGYYGEIDSRVEPESVITAEPAVQPVTVVDHSAVGALHLTGDASCGTVSLDDGEAALVVPSQTDPQYLNQFYSLGTICDRLLNLYFEGYGAYAAAKRRYTPTEVADFSFNCSAIQQPRDVGRVLWPLAYDRHDAISVIPSEVYYTDAGMVAWTDAARFPIYEGWIRYMKSKYRDVDDGGSSIGLFGSIGTMNGTVREWNCSITDVVKWDLTTLNNPIRDGGGFFIQPVLKTDSGYLDVRLHEGNETVYVVQPGNNTVVGRCDLKQKLPSNHTVAEIFASWNKENICTGKYKVRNFSFRPVLPKRRLSVNKFNFNMEHVKYLHGLPKQPKVYPLVTTAYIDEMHEFLSVNLAKSLCNEVLTLNDSYGLLGHALVAGQKLVTPAHVFDYGITNPERIGLNRDCCATVMDELDIAVVSGSGYEALSTKMRLRVPLEVEVVVIVKREVTVGDDGIMRGHYVVTEPLLMFRQSYKFSLVNRFTSPGDSGAIVVALSDLAIVGLIKGGLLDYNTVSMVINISDKLLTAIYAKK